MARFLTPENMAVVQAVMPQACTSIAGDWVSMKNYRHLSIIISLDVTTGTDTGAVTLDQATLVDGTGTKTLGFEKVWVNSNAETGSVFTETAVTSDTFLAGGAENGSMYIIEVEADTLDVENDFDCVQIDIASITNGEVNVTYLLSQPRYSGQSSAMPDPTSD